MIHIAIADDHAIVRSGLKQIFETTTDIAVVGEASNSMEVLELCRKVSCDLLLLDMTMPGSSGVELIKRLRVEMPSLPILILSMHNEGQIVSLALKAGATGYVTKDSETEILLSAIRRIAAGGKFIDPSLVEIVVFNPLGDENFPHDSLSERELQVLKMIASGTSLNDIAYELHLSPKTISTHKMRLMQKLSIDNNADLVRYATKHGLLSK